MGESNKKNPKKNQGMKGDHIGRGTKGKLELREREGEISTHKGERASKRQARIIEMPKETILIGAGGEKRQKISETTPFRK